MNPKATCHIIIPLHNGNNPTPFFANLILLLLKINYKLINQIIFLTVFEVFGAM